MSIQSLTPRFVPEGKFVNDSEDPNFVCLTHDEATAARIARLLSEEEHFLNQEPSEEMASWAAINDNTR